MLTTQPAFSTENFDLSSDELVETPWDARAASRGATVTRLGQYRILPLDHDRLSMRTLEQIEQLFTTWFELSDDASRRTALPYVFAAEGELRAALLAIVPLYYDTLFFDEQTPTRDLVEIALVAHAKWRRWLTSADARA